MEYHNLIKNTLDQIPQANSNHTRNFRFLFLFYTY